MKELYIKNVSVQEPEYLEVKTKCNVGPTVTTSHGLDACQPALDSRARNTACAASAQRCSFASWTFCSKALVSNAAAEQYPYHLFRDDVRWQACGFTLSNNLTPNVNQKVPS
jgi:hypothetical protein